MLKKIISLIEKKELIEARKLLLSIFDNNQGNPDVHHLISICEKEMGNLEAAEIAVTKAIEIKQATIFKNTYAAILILKKDYRRAIEILNELLNQVDEKFSVDVHINLATAYRAIDDYENSIIHCKRANSIDQTRWEPIDIFATILIDKRNYKGATELLTKLINNPKAKNAIGKLFATAVKNDDFAFVKRNYVHIREKVDLRQKIQMDLSLIGMLSSMSKFSEAHSVATQARNEAKLIADNTKDEVIIHINLAEAGVYARECKFSDALNIYKSIIDFDNKSIVAKWNSSLIELAQGNLIEGWELYEARWEWKEFPSLRRKFAIPRWRGEPCKKLLVWAEQGVGDQIIFISMINELVEKGIDVRLEINSKLHSIVKYLHPTVQCSVPGPEICTGIESYNVFDYQIPIGSLCQLLRTNKEDFLKPTKVLNFKKNYREEIINESGNCYSKLIGICWKSSNLSGARKDFYITLDQTIELIARNKEFLFVNLQYDINEEEINYIKSKVENFITYDKVDLYNDMLDGCRLISSLDFVITAGTTIVYQAALANKVTYTWGYRDDFSLCGFDTYPWYPNINLIMMQRPPNKKLLINKLTEIIQNTL